MNTIKNSVALQNRRLTPITLWAALLILNQLTQIVQASECITLTDWKVGHENDWTWPKWREVDMWKAYEFQFWTGFKYNWEKYILLLNYIDYLNNWPTRTEALDRIDEVALNIQKKVYENISIWWWFQYFWDIWWEEIQETIHELISDTSVKQAEYWQSFFTPTINASYWETYWIWSGFNLETKAELALPIIPDYWVANINTEAMITNEILWVKFWAWIIIWGTRYPNKWTFISAPLSDENWFYSKTKAEVSFDIKWINVWVWLSIPTSWWEANTNSHSTLSIWLSWKF